MPDVVIGVDDSEDFASTSCSSSCVDDDDDDDDNDNDVGDPTVFASPPRVVRCVLVLRILVYQMALCR